MNLGLVATLGGIFLRTMGNPKIGMHVNRFIVKYLTSYTYNILPV